MRTITTDFIDDYASWLLLIETHDTINTIPEFSFDLLKPYNYLFCCDLIFFFSRISTAEKLYLNTVNNITVLVLTVKTQI